jgi:DnaJ-class molecular chaperone
MKKFEQIDAARIMLELPQRASMEEIKCNYRTLIRKWHPDKCKEDPAKCREMTNGIIAAYRILNDYCKNYKFSFSKEEVSRYLSAEEWWFERFGKSSCWGDEQKDIK